MDRVTLSVAVIAKNERDRIGRLITSAAFADEIIVVDSGSTDGTVTFCEKMGCRVVAHSWEGYAAQKQFAMSCASSQWVLNLDADEEISRELADEMQKRMAAAESRNISGFSMPRLSRYLGRWIRHGGWYPDRKVRLVRAGQANWCGEGLHEKLVTDGPVLKLYGPILHYVYRNISDQIVTINKFSDLYAAEKRSTTGWFVVAGVLHAFGKFIECYFWKRGLLDGVAGLVIAMNSAWYIFLKHAKSWETDLGKDSDHLRGSREL
jgi:glycosyltransferase involved in cell wall biosynthesis